MFWSQHLGCWGQTTSRIQNKEVDATLYLQAEKGVKKIATRQISIFRKPLAKKKSKQKVQGASKRLGNEKAARGRSRHASESVSVDETPLKVQKQKGRNLHSAQKTRLNKRKQVAGEVNETPVKAYRIDATMSPVRRSPRILKSVGGPSSASRRSPRIRTKMSRRGDGDGDDDTVPGTPQRKGRVLPL